MSIKIYKPTSEGRRQMTGVDFSVLTETEPANTKATPRTMMPKEARKSDNFGGMYITNYHYSFFLKKK